MAEPLIAHADMDAFYASIEQLDHPELRGLPVIVGPRSRRGVVLTASYEARPYGVGSAMPMSRAMRLCPHARVVPPRFERYQQASAQIMAAFADFSPRVEPLSLDEAFLDMSGSAHLFGPPEDMGLALKRAVTEATGGLTASVGIATTKYVAKVASGYAKPDGLTIVPEAETVAWLAPQSVARLWGAGPRTQERLHALGLDTIGDLANADPRWLKDQLGAMGTHFYELAQGRDPRRVRTGREARSISSDRTLETDVSGRAAIEPHLRRAADSLGKRLRRKSLLAHGVRVKLKSTDFKLHTRQQLLERPTDSTRLLFEAGAGLLDSFEHAGPWRLIGLAAYELTDATGPAQLGLFDAPRQRRRKLESALDDIAQRFGDEAVGRARDLGRNKRSDLNLDFLDETPGEEPDAVDGDDEIWPPPEPDPLNP